MILSEASYQFIFMCFFFTFGLLIGHKQGNPIFNITEIVYVNLPDTLRMKAFHTECWYIQDLWKEGILNPIEADFIDRRLP